MLDHVVPGIGEFDAIVVYRTIYNFFLLIALFFYVCVIFSVREICVPSFEMKPNQVKIVFIL